MTQVSPVIIVPEHPQTGTIKVPVVKVFDGDGFLTRFKAHEVTGNRWDQAEIELTARFGFIDAPEMEQPGGREARDFLVSLIGEQWLELVILTKMDTGRSMDRHGRVVCVPFDTGLRRLRVPNLVGMLACEDNIRGSSPDHEKHRIGDGHQRLGLGPGAIRPRSTIPRRPGGGETRKAGHLGTR